MTFFGFSRVLVVITVAVVQEVFRSAIFAINLAVNQQYAYLCSGVLYYYMCTAVLFSMHCRLHKVTAALAVNLTMFRHILTARPGSPGRPGGPMSPTSPRSPASPRAPFAPVSPTSPGGPDSPGLPMVTTVIIIRSSASLPYLTC